MYLGHPERALTLAQEPTLQCAALLAMGRYQEVLDKFPDNYLSDSARLNLGRAEDVLARDPGSTDARLMLGRLDDLRQGTGSAADHARTLAGDPIPADSKYRDEAWAMMAAGRYDEAFSRYGNDLSVGMWPRHWFMLEAFIAGDTTTRVVARRGPTGLGVPAAAFRYRPLPDRALPTRTRR
jgi:hypothetical protein